MKQRSLHNFARRSRPGFRGGASLVEMMVSIGITVGMLAAAGVVYKSAGDASGQAMANSVILERYRSLTSQLKSDFTGLRPDMPMAIIFAADAYGRYDRIVFFADGDFQTNDYNYLSDNISANVARIIYGQSLDGWIPNRLRTPAHSTAPLRQILARRCNLITSNAKNWVTAPLVTPADYDYYPIDYAISLADWKNMPFDDTSMPIDFKRVYFMDNPAMAASIIRRPDIGAVKTIGYDGLERLYFLPDVTDFKIQLWYDKNDAPVGYAERWFPDYWDMPDTTFDKTLYSGPGIMKYMYAFFWNVFNSPTNYIHIDNSIDWWSENALKNVFSWQHTWPKAIKFTFTLYDKNRHHYPQGRTFSYIIDLPSR